MVARSPRTELLLSSSHVQKARSIIYSKFGPFCGNSNYSIVSLTIATLSFSSEFWRLFHTASWSPLGEKFVLCSRLLIEPSWLSTLCRDSRRGGEAAPPFNEHCRRTFGNRSMWNDATDIKILMDLKFVTLWLQCDVWRFWVQTADGSNGCFLRLSVHRVIISEAYKILNGAICC